ncbi:HAUS augmin-like complex subunit 6 isoform X2 [Centrocercus urophasianus]|uniref:HAUS augmin-like complex subunit 6 isoform X2 n=1 Tax=Centrocercus urophasianus TaxID=9002 RepID=UPI001C645EB2|nr:HAUS augmin-like complex subunit 6 isoform X2 [Centrocercus urophasianus]
MFRRRPGAVGAEWNWEKEHLWLYLLALGFDPKAAEGASGTNLLLGPTAFDMPSYSTFHVIALFLFTKLDKQRAVNTFRNCMFPDVKPSDLEFRKLCSSWLKEISNEEGSGIPQAAASFFLYSTGHKFIHLMYRFARYVVVKDLKKSSADSKIPFVKAVCFSPEDLCKADERCRVARNELLQILLRKDYIIRKYKKTSQCLIKEIKQMKCEYTHLQQQLQKMESKELNKKDRAERIQKVRSMWTLITETFSSLKKEMEIVESVCGGHVDQIVFDGSNVVVSIPRLLVDKVENETREVYAGNLYEGEKLNFLTVIQLLNEALRILRDESYRFDSKNHLQPIVNMATLQSKMLLHLEAVRQSIENKCFILNKSNSRRQKELIMKWERYPGWSSLCNQDLDLSVVQAVSEAEKDCEDYIFSQNPGSDSDILDLWEISYGNSESTISVSSSLTPTRWISSKSSELSETSENKDLLTEKDLHIEPDSGKEKPMPPRISEDGKDELTLSESWENSEGHVTQRDAPLEKKVVLEKAREELAEEIAKIITSESPQSDAGRGIASDDLIDFLDFNPFLTRKQIHRTPENLLSEIRNSWRKAIQSEDLSDAELVSTEEIIDAPVDASPAIQDKAAISLDGGSSSSAVPNVDYPLSEQKSKRSSAEFAVLMQMISQINVPMIWEETSEILEDLDSEEELEDAVSGESFIGKTKQSPCMYVEKSLNTPCISSEDSSKVKTLPSDHLLGLMDKDLLWNASPVLSSKSCEVDDFGMLHETTPEELSSRSSNKFVMSESGLGFLGNVFIPHNTVNQGNILNLKPNLDSLLSRYKMLKKSVSGEEQELHEVFIGDESLSNFSDISLSPDEGERGDLQMSVERFSLDEEFAKIKSPVSLPDKNSSLPSLLVFSKHLEEMASKINEIPLDLINKLKDKEKLNEKLSTKESPSLLKNL